MKKAAPKLRPPKPVFERIKLPTIILGYIFLSEWSTPLPFYVTTMAKLLVLALVFFILREFHHARLEVDPGWVSRTEKRASAVRSRLKGVRRETWLKIQRVVIYAIAVYAFGAVLNILTDRCDSAIQCAVSAPRMAIENLPTFIQFALYMAISLLQIGLMMYSMVKVGSFKVVMPGTISTTFDDVWGQDKAKAKVMEQVKLLENSDHVDESGGYMPKGLLLYGPPGTGKTYLAKAAANYSSKPLILVPPGAFQATFVGINLLKVWTLFRNIRKLARRYGGCIVFIDEIDSLGSRGGSVETEAVAPRYAPGCVPFPLEPQQIVVTGGGGMGTLEAFLSAMDGMEDPRGFLNRTLVFLGFKALKPPEYKYLMMGATNMLQRLDPALLRAGRFGRKILVTYPKQDGRLKTYEGYLSRVKNSLTPKNIEWAARNHASGTGAEIKDIVNEALLITFRDDRKHPGTIGFDDLMRAMMWIKFGESDGPFERDAGRWAVAIHEAGHAVAVHHLALDREAIWFVSIEQHGQAGGMVVPTSKREDWLLMRHELLGDIQISLASRIAEHMFFGEATNGHGGDGPAATQIAERMVRLGLAEGQIGSYDGDAEKFSALTENVLKEALSACNELLTPLHGEIETVATMLYERGMVPGDEIHAALGGAA